MKSNIQSLLNIKLPSVEQTIQLNSHFPQDIKLSIKRDDTIHPIISGNKWRKIKYQLLEALERNTTHIISFGGGFSNHLHALGYCCQQLNMKFTAVVRGDYSRNPSPMLQDLTSWNTNICYVNKITYQKRNTSYLAELKTQFPDALIVPEGGSSQFALQGVAEIINELHQEYDYIIAPVASGGTLAGLINAVESRPINNPPKILGVAALKGQGYLEELVTQLLPQNCNNSNWQIIHDFHFGGYAKTTVELIEFCQNFKQQHQIEIEPIYSGKLFFALDKLLQQNYFPKGSRILALHTGGLQGAR
ncbi:1-aminocyclopropane-1-carboxylate deaminase/D-cysteine desulfhydrase [Paraglaciecola sp.]|uniref:1-aminocyclopropane-1-carboxylate deaminase/D-cysteine desulfhydrase n=1 Tax=Paraglaciecola sp. TaxID=1920173 RepID=UPI003EF29B01